MPFEPQQHPATAEPQPAYWHLSPPYLPLSAVGTRQSDHVHARHPQSFPTITNTGRVARCRNASAAGFTSLRGVCPRCISGDCQCSVNVGGSLSPTPRRAQNPLNSFGWRSPGRIQFEGAHWTAGASFVYPTPVGTHTNSAPSSPPRSGGPALCNYCHERDRGFQVCYAKHSTHKDQEICHPCASWERRTIPGLTVEEFWAKLQRRRGRSPQPV
jgi:hypothetical protein